MDGDRFLFLSETNQFSISSWNFKSFADFTPDLNDATLGARGFSRMRREFSVLAEGRHIFGRRSHERRSCEKNLWHGAVLFTIRVDLWAFRAGHYKDLTETRNRARKVSGTQGRMTQTPLIFIWNKTGNKRRVTCFATLLQDVLKSAFYHPLSNLFFINSDCCRLRKVVAESRE